MQTRAIVISGWSPGLAVVRSLGRRGVPVTLVSYDPGDAAVASRYVEDVFRAPNPDRDPAGFSSVLATLSRKYPGSVLIPCTDPGVVAVAKEWEQLAANFVMACPDWDVARLYIEKRHTYEIAAKMGLGSPRTLRPESLEEAIDQAKSIGFPCLVKPSVGHLYTAAIGTKMTEVGDIASLTAAYEEANEHSLDVVIQEVIPGPPSNGVNFNSYRTEEGDAVEFTVRKLRNGPPRYGSPRAAVSEHIDGVAEPSRELLAAMGYYGFSCIEYKYDDRDGRFKLMEVNGRHNLSASLADKCGIDFPWIEYSHLVTGTKPTAKDSRDGVYWVDILRDGYWNVVRQEGDRHSMKDLLRPYLRLPAFAIWQWRDPKPFARRLGTALKSRGKRV